MSLRRLMVLVKGISWVQVQSTEEQARPRVPIAQQLRRLMGGSRSSRKGDVIYVPRKR